MPSRSLSCCPFIAQIVAAALHSRDASSHAGELLPHAAVEYMLLRIVCELLLSGGQPFVRDCDILSGMLSDIAGHKASSGVSS